jgi:hypothetical protein
MKISHSPLDRLPLPPTTCWGYDKEKQIKVPQLWDVEGVRTAVTNAFEHFGMLWEPLTNFNHIWRNVLTGRYVYSDETHCFSATDYATPTEADEALTRYCKEML